MVDGTCVVVHQGAANVTGGVYKQAMGRTRGGRNAKIKALTDSRVLNVKPFLIKGKLTRGIYVIPLSKPMRDCW